MAVLQNPATGSIIQATGRLQQRLTEQGWTPTNQPSTPGLRIITAAELEQVATIVTAVTTWRDQATTAIAAIQATAVDIPTAIQTWMTAHPAPAVDYTQLTNKPALGTAAAKDTGTGATQVILGNDTRLTDTRTPTGHTHPAGQVTGLHAVATSGVYDDLTGKPGLTFDPAGSSATAQAAAVQRANHTGTQPAASITGLHAVATSGDYNALTNKPVITNPTVVRLTGDHAPFTTTSLVNVTGLSFPVVAGTYYRFRFDLIFRTPALTTGAGFGLTTPAATAYTATVTIPFAADGAAANWIGYLTTSGDSVLSTGVQAINTDHLATIEGVILPSANGTVQLQAKTEVSSSNLTVRNGSQLSY